MPDLSEERTELIHVTVLVRLFRPINKLQFEKSFELGGHFEFLTRDNHLLELSSEPLIDLLLNFLELEIQQIKKDFFIIRLVPESLLVLFSAIPLPLPPCR